MQKICPFSYCIFCSFQWGGNSGPRKFRPKHQKFRPIFSSELFWLSLFGFSLWRGSGILPRKFPRKFPGVRNFRSLVRNFRPKENLAKSFSRFLSGGGPELCTGYLLRKFPGHRKFRCKPRNIRPPAGSSGPFNPEFPALRFSNG